MPVQESIIVTFRKHTLLIVYMPYKQRSRTCRALSSLHRVLLEMIYLIDLHVKKAENLYI